MDSLVVNFRRHHTDVCNVQTSAGSEPFLLAYVTNTSLFSQTAALDCSYHMSDSACHVADM